MGRHIELKFCKSKLYLSLRKETTRIYSIPIVLVHFILVSLLAISRCHDTDSSDGIINDENEVLSKSNVVISPLAALEGKERDEFILLGLEGDGTDIPGIDYSDRKVKYGKMMSSPYSFYRGTAFLFWRDLGQDDRLNQFGGNNDNVENEDDESRMTTTWLSGDAHIYNFGSYHDGASSSTVVYGLDDFDESIFGDYQLDLWRLAVSILLTIRENDNLSDDADVQDVVDAVSYKYLHTMRQMAQKRTKNNDNDEEKLLSNSDVPLTKHNTYGKLDDFLKIVQKKKSRNKMLDKYAPFTKTDQGSKARRFDLTNVKLDSVTPSQKEAILNAFPEYLETLSNSEVINHPIKILDIARRLLAGTGSLGFDRFYILIQDGSDVIRILDMKRQFTPVGYRYVPPLAKQVYDKHAKNDNDANNNLNFKNDGKCTCDGAEKNDARAMMVAYQALNIAAHPDPYVGYMVLPQPTNDDGKESSSSSSSSLCSYFSVKERSPYKESYPALLEEATGKYEDLKLDSRTRYFKLAEQWGYALALHHTQANHKLPTNIMARVGSHDGEFVKLVRDIAFEYANRTKKDWEGFVNHLDDDFVPFEEGS